MVKDIIVNLSVGKPHDVAGDYAISVASTFDAHLSGVACAYEPVVGGMAFPSVAASLIDAFRAESEAAAHRAKHTFDENARRAAISADSIVIAGTASEAATRLGELARDYDLSIVAQAQPDGDVSESMAIEGALFGSGRPVLVVPYIQSSGLKLDRVMVCWDGSRNAARAVGDAMPFLKRAGAIDVVTVERQERRNELIGARIAARPRSAQIITGRRRNRSTQAPATRPTSRPAIKSMLRTSATPNASAFRVRIATNGSARRVMRLPKIEMVAAAQMRWKAPLRHKVGVGS